MKVSVVIPCYNEENRIENCVSRLSGYLSAKYPDYEIVLSNDGSTDRTASLAAKAAEADPNVKCVGYERNRGKGCAVRTGMLAAEGDFIIYTDCDLAYGTEPIGRAVDLACEKGYGVVLGSRNLDKESYEGYTFTRKIMSKIYLRVISAASGFSHSDSQCGFKAYRRDAARDVFSECEIDSFAFDLEALIKAENKGYRIGEMPVKIIEHDESKSKIRPVRDTLKMLRDIRRIKKKEKILRDNK